MAQGSWSESLLTATQIRIRNPVEYEPVSFEFHPPHLCHACGKPMDAPLIDDGFVVVVGNDAKLFHLACAPAHLERLKPPVYLQRLKLGQ